MSHHYSKFAKCYKKIRLLYVFKFVSEIGLLTGLFPHVKLSHLPFFQKKKKMPLYKPLQKKDLR